MCIIVIKTMPCGYLEQGVEISRDSDGNIYAMKLTNNCDVIVRGCQDTRNSCLSDEVLHASGHLVTNKKTKVDVPIQQYFVL